MSRSLLVILGLNSTKHIFPFLNPRSLTHCRSIHSQCGDYLTDRYHFGSRTSVARFENGTTVNLAQIRGSPQYVALMERLIQKPKTPSWLGHLGTIGHWLSIWRSLKSIAGLPATRESGILAEMVAALKSESERTLQTRIETAAVTAPWMAVWDNWIPGDSVVNDALVLAGLEPIDWMANEPIYLGETNAVLAANGRFICKELWCGDELEGNVSNEFAYLIRSVTRPNTVHIGSWHAFFPGLTRVR